MLQEERYEEEEYNENATSTKEYVRDPNNVMVSYVRTRLDVSPRITTPGAWTRTLSPSYLSQQPVDTDLIGGAVDQFAVRPPTRGSNPSSESRSRLTDMRTNIDWPLLTSKMVYQLPAIYPTGLSTLTTAGITGNGASLPDNTNSN
mmetsp:Transcript_11616/g.20929  ORF Transcript_11616/g.20929 Transcript_11616/m.20929 type:complete len:146 (+) Transcript_11616:382-819(+)